MLSITALRTGYAGGPDVLRDISLSVGSGEIVAVLGRNGAGKTTLLRAISGLLPHRSGEVRLQGRSLQGMRPYRIARQGLSHVPEGRRLMPGMSVRDNLLLGAFPLRDTRQIAALLDEVLGVFPVLHATMDAQAGTLSGGQQQMVAIARGLMSGPRVLLLDEPLTGLAPVIQDDVMATLSRLRDDARAIVVVEQNVQRSLDVADRAAVLANGTVAVQGTASDLAGDPAVREQYLSVDTDPPNESENPA